MQFDEDEGPAAGDEPPEDNYYELIKLDSLIEPKLIT